MEKKLELKDGKVVVKKENKILCNSKLTILKTNKKEIKLNPYGYTKINNKFYCPCNCKDIKEHLYYRFLIEKKKKKEINCYDSCLKQAYYYHLYYPNKCTTKKEHRKRIKEIKKKQKQYKEYNKQQLKEKEKIKKEKQIKEQNLFENLIVRTELLFKKTTKITKTEYFNTYEIKTIGCGKGKIIEILKKKGMKIEDVIKEHNITFEKTKDGRIGKNETSLLDMIEKENNITIKRNTSIKANGKIYYPDGKDEENKIIYEIDEPGHNNIKQQIKDKKREDDIKNKTGYTFIRIRDGW